MTEKIRNHIKRCENTTLEKIDFSNKKYCLSVVYVESNSNLNIQANLCKTTTLGAQINWPLWTGGRCSEVTSVLKVQNWT
jgi:hypothetical protein